jgi:site-specific DNA-methyltransferase (adenine-specific)
MGGGQDIAQQPGQTRVADVIDVPVGGIDAGIQHPAMFPTELAEILVKTFCPPKGSVLDNFCGSGSTLLGVERAGQGRTFYGFDIEPNYVAIALQRLAEHNGQTQSPSSEIIPQRQRPQRCH